MRFFFLMFLFACDVEDVGVQLPQGGVDAVTASDLRHNLWSLTDPRLGGRVPGSSGAKRVGQHIRRQMQKSHLEPGFGEVFLRDLGPERGEIACGVRPGGGSGAQVVVALDPGVGTLSAVPIAGLLSLAQAFDGPDKEKQSFVFCVLPESGGLKSYVAEPPHPLDQTAAFTIIGSLTGDALQAAPGPEIAAIRSTVLHTGPIASKLGDDMGAMDFDALATQVRAVYLRLGEAH